MNVEPSWGFLKDVSLWQLGIVIIAITILCKALVRLWPGLKNTIKLIDSVGALPEFMETTQEKLEEVHHELHFNSGSTAKDAIRRVEKGVAGVYPQLEELHRKVEEHIEHSIRWKARLNEVDERTQPGRPMIEGNSNNDASN